MKRPSILVIAILLASLSISCVPLKAPVATFKKYEVRNVNMSSTEFNFIFDIDNQNDIPLDIKNVEYRFYLEGTELLSGESTGFNMSAKDKKEISIPIVINYLNALRSVAKATKTLLSGGKKLNYKLEGDLVIESLGASARAPLAAQGELTLIN